MTLGPASLMNKLSQNEHFPRSTDNIVDYLLFVSVRFVKHDNPFYVVRPTLTVELLTGLFILMRC